MGLLDRLAKAIVEAQLEKAPNLPAGAVSLTEQQMQQAARGNSYQTKPLPRNPNFGNVPFAPGLPITPGAINPVGPGGQADPRRYEYQVAQNINVATEQKLVPFKTLRGAAEQIDIVRRCIEVLKSKITGLDWDIVIAEDASEKIIAEIGGDHVRAMAQAREKFSDEIYRARSFWENPDPSNGLTFIDWLMISLEEILVLDAWSIWPQKTVGGDLLGLQVLDGSTIKPLLDDRGMRPVPPQAAYQQILYGFPRSEFSSANEMPEADGEFTAQEMTYLVRNRRANSVYGNSPVERCLPVADLYLRRQQWLRAEWTNGVLPELMFKVDPDFGNDPILLRQLEDSINDDLSGQTEQRKRARVLPAGFDPVQFDGYGEKFKEILDTYLVTSICGHFGVMPTEIGFSGHGGLGSSGHQQGEQQNAQQIGVGPLVTWLSKMLTNMSYSYLGMPRELEFKFMIAEGHDNEQEAKRADLELRGATKTINERRSELGLPLLDTPAADQPMLVAGQSVFLFSPDGIINVSTATGQPPSVDNLETNPIAPVEDKPAPVAPVAPIPGEEPKPGEEKPEPKVEPGASKSADIDKAGVPSKAEVKAGLSRLKILPNAAGDHPTSDNPEKLADSVASPWPLVETQNGDYPVSPDVWEKAELALVNVKDLYGTDTQLDRKNVADHIEAMGQALTPYRNYALVYDDGEKQVIVDGHHRLMAMWLLGMDQVPVWLGTADMGKAAAEEARAFIKWADKPYRRTRSFEFKALDPIVGDALNRCYFDGDMDTAKSLVKAYLL
jgi:Phage portal protein